MGDAVTVVESPLLRVTFEAFKRGAKDRKALLDEAASAATAVQPLASCSSSEQRKAHVDSLNKLLDNLQGIKRKLGEVSRSEREEAARCKARLEHLKAIGVPGKDQVIAWTKQRLDRLLVDHLMRQGCHATAAQLIQDLRLGDLVDAHVFSEARVVAEALRRHDCGPCLAWCAENRAKLRKIKSKLEFRLRVQEFIELVRADRRMEAILYARQHLAPWAPQHMQELQRAVATLAFTAKTKCDVYRALFDDAQWAALSDLFHQDLYRLHCLTPESLLVVHLQAGLSALKTPLSYQPGCSKEDPLHLPLFQRLAEGLPFAKHMHSKLLCSVTKQPMNEENPPMVLPNGYVYSARAVEVLLSQHGGRVVCPKTGGSYGPEELRRVFIV